ncbi:MAG: hypothetical protein AAF357_18905, partial [Verrucomicrobiota bacterium]
MMTNCTRILAWACLPWFSSGLVAQDEARELAFAISALNRVEAKPSVAGDGEGWFFLVRELRHLSTADFWRTPWDEVAANATNPIPSMVEFQGLLADRGVQLLLVPIPAKGRIYPEKLDQKFKFSDSTSLSPFIEMLRAEGLNVIDLDQRFREARSEADEIAWYCAQDA